MHAPGAAPVTHRAVLAVAVPMTLAHVTTPMIGFVDLAVIGQTGDAAAIGGVAAGAVLMSFLFWPFGFLRMGTAGMTAQALGAGDTGEQRAALMRALLIAAAIGLALVAAGVPLRAGGLRLAGGSAEVQRAVGIYFDIRILSAPFALANYVFLGWLVGMGRAGLGLALQLVLNLANMALSALFTLQFGLGIAGVAWGTVAAEAIAAVAGAALAWRLLGGRIGVPRAAVFDPARLKRTVAVNRDIMIRSALLLGAILLFTRQSAALGDDVLAANGLLKTIVAVGVYALDGLATAVEQLAGRALGARDRAAFVRAARLTLLWSVAVAAVVTAVLLGAGGALAAFMTPSGPVRALAVTFLPYAAAIPLAGALAFHQDGLYIGATWTGAMRDMMILSCAVYGAALALLIPAFGNHGLWAAYLIFLLVRGAALAAAFPRQMRRAFSP